MAAVYWSLGMLAAPRHVAPPLLIFAILPLALFTFKVGKLVYLYHTRVGATTLQTLAAALAGLSLTHTIGLATLTGFLVKSKPFLRTPRQASDANIRFQTEKTPADHLHGAVLCSVVPDQQPAVRRADQAGGHSI